MNTMNLDLIGETRTKKYLLQDAIFDLIKEFEQETGQHVIDIKTPHVNYQPPEDVPQWHLLRVDVTVQDMNKHIEEFKYIRER